MCFRSLKRCAIRKANSTSSPKTTCERAERFVFTCPPSHSPLSYFLGFANGGFCTFDANAHVLQEAQELNKVVDGNKRMAAIDEAQAKIRGAVRESEREEQVTVYFF